MSKSEFKQGLRMNQEALYSGYKNTIEMTNDRQIHRQNYQWQASIHFNWPMVGQREIDSYKIKVKH